MIRNVGQGQILQGLECQAKEIPICLMYAEQLLKVYKRKRDTKNMQIKAGEQNEREQGTIRSVGTKLLQEFGWEGTTPGNERGKNPSMSGTGIFGDVQVFVFVAMLLRIFSNSF